MTAGIDGGDCDRVLAGSEALGLREPAGERDEVCTLKAGHR